MNEVRYISSIKVLAVSLWLMVGGLMLAAWVLVFTPGRDYDMVSALLGLTAGCLAVAAGVINVKLYVSQAMGLIRTTAGLAPADVEEFGLRSVR